MAKLHFSEGCAKQYPYIGKNENWWIDGKDTGSNFHPIEAGTELDETVEANSNITPIYAIYKKAE